MQFALLGVWTMPQEAPVHNCLLQMFSRNIRFQFLLYGKNPACVDICFKFFPAKPMFFRKRFGW